MRLPAAVLWDVDGTLAETERDGHRTAFNQAFEAHGLGWYWDEAHYGRLLAVTGGRERLLHDMRSRPDAPSDDAQREALARSLHERKNALYAHFVANAGVPLRDGVRSLMRACRAHAVPMGITTTTSRSNVDALLAAALGAGWSDWFAVLVCGEDVRHKKPDPEVYLRALRALAVEPAEVVAIEDSPAGVAAARAARVPALVTRSFYFAQAEFDGALAIGPGLHTRSGWAPPLPARADAHRAVDLQDLGFWLAGTR